MLPFQGENHIPKIYPGRCPGLGYAGLSARRAGSQVVLIDAKYSVFGRRGCEK